MSAHPSSAGVQSRRRVLRLKRKRKDMESGELGDVIVLKTKRTRKIAVDKGRHSGGLISALTHGLTLDPSALAKSVNSEHDQIMVFRRVSKSSKTTKPSISIGRTIAEHRRKTDRRTAALLASAQEFVSKERRKRDSRKTQIRSVTEDSDKFDHFTHALDQAAAAGDACVAASKSPMTTTSSVCSESEKSLVEYLQLRYAMDSTEGSRTKQWSLQRDCGQSEMKVDDRDEDEEIEEFEQISRDHHGLRVDEIAKHAKPAAIFFVDMGQLEDWTDGLMDQMELTTSKDECYDFSLGSKRRRRERRLLTDDHTAMADDGHSGAVGRFLAEMDHNGHQLREEQSIIDRMERATQSECRVLGYQSDGNMDEDDWDNPDEEDFYGNDYGTSEDCSSSSESDPYSVPSTKFIDPINDHILLQM